MEILLRKRSICQSLLVESKYVGALAMSEPNCKLCTILLISFIETLISLPPPSLLPSSWF
ncbi:hypothetical protein RchiOBHm_Chr6g0268761 [Rosa chinensis]|uniref:Uncharacterized protein n=1 Tax=Rosa chinensis TaxID=74649 RepID=A0A2P6PQA4_ROSCH|nr:hypothetical protein RchiOBHm_Chr6g0268761 [Rosa chinensis]